MVFAGGLADNIEPQFGLNNHRLEDIGLTLRPELRIEAYQKKIDQQDIYKEILKMLPGIWDDRRLQLQLKQPALHQHAGVRSASAPPST